MRRLVQTLALGAALIAVIVGVWRDYGAVVTLQRAAVAYLAAYFLAGLMSVAGSAALRGAREPAPPPEPDDKAQAGKRRQNIMLRNQKPDAGGAPPPATNAGRPAAPTAVEKGRETGPGIESAASHRNS